MKHIISLFFHMHATQLDEETKRVDDVFNDEFRKNSESHRYFLWQW